MDTNSVLLIAGVCIVMGFLIGLMVNSLRKEPDTDSSDNQRETMLKVWKAPKNNDLIIELDGKEYERSVSITSQQRNQMNQIILRMHDWLTYAPSQKQENIPKKTAIDAPPDLGSSEKPKPRFSLNPINMLTNALKADVPLSQLPTESIVTQIDVILQDKLKNSPLSGEPIRLMEWLNKGIVVMVGLEQFDSVDEIPNDEIKKLIRSAVEEWEQRGTENL